MRRTHSDRWLLSYADFVTLLFAAFVVFYAISRNSSPHRPGMAATVSHAKSPLFRDLEAALSPELRNGSLALTADPRGDVLELSEQICFAAGAVEVQDEAKPMLAKIAAILSRYPNKIVLVGHTDSQPIHNRSYRSNWELSTARGISVMLLLEQMAPIDAGRFLIEGAADNKPVSDNTTDAGRAKNRRVEIIALSS